jgi:hypothetical protein
MIFLKNDSQTIEQFFRAFALDPLFAQNSVVAITPFERTITGTDAGLGINSNVPRYIDFVNTGWSANAPVPNYVLYGYLDWTFSNSGGVAANTRLEAYYANYNLSSQLLFGLLQVQNCQFSKL